MAKLTQEQLDSVKTFVYAHGRLLERQLYELAFGKGTQLACVTTLLAYQNPDGGFGNGLEPDLRCPESSGIAAETALFLMDLVNFRDPSLIQMLYRWIRLQQTDAGVIPHPSGSMLDYPHQPWWENPDDDRVLSLAGYLRKLGVPHSPFFEGVRGYFEDRPLPSPEDYYGYPYFIYLKYCGETEADREKLETMVSRMPTLLEKHADHYPLFSRAWYHARDLLPEAVVASEADRFIEALGDTGAVETAYPDLPWWDAPWTLDGLILIQKADLLEIQ